MEYRFTPDGVQIDDQPPLSSAELYGYCFRKDKSKDLAERWVEEMAEVFLRGLVTSTGLELERGSIKPEWDDEEIAGLVAGAPYAQGAGNITREWVLARYSEMLSVYSGEISSFDGSVDLYLTRRGSSLEAPTRVYFHLVENPTGATPFAFMATYSSVDDSGVVRHYPLKYALLEYKDDMKGLALLVEPISKISRESELIASLVQSGEVFHPLNFTLEEAWTFLSETPSYEEKGIVCRVPQFWKRRRRSTSVTLSVPRKARIGHEEILTLTPSLVYDGVELSEEELNDLLAQTEGLAFMKGRWIEVDHERLEKLKETFELFADGVEPREAILYATGLKEATGRVRFASPDWLSDAFRDLVERWEVPSSLNATLRPYQEKGFRYLMAMDSLTLAPCLADDMGLGKTVQVIAHLIAKKEAGAEKVLLVVPSSLLGNWSAELRRFAPSLSFSVYHGAGRQLTDDYITITTYSMVSRNVEELSKVEWDEVVLDEAQNIKNPKTAQAKAVKSLPRKSAVILTGTPIENNLMNLWSLFDFANPGILGNMTAFSKWCKGLDSEKMARFKTAIAPFILRRLKSDKSIISDLPDKVETKLYATATKKQAILYKAVVEQTAQALAEADGEEKKKMNALAAIMKLKQICNHPDQYTGEGPYSVADSGKTELLVDICSTIRDNREKVLVFTQFTEVIPHLMDILWNVFGAPGLTIDGSVAPKKRTEIVKSFQEGKAPFMVLSLRAAGVGLNLTAATNVIHFDRWWNPAVENQATDRAYRIGQKEKVSVYKFMMKDTIEEAIDDIIEEKSRLAVDALGEKGSDALASLTADELLAAMKFRGGQA